jgi:hypothetical protein
MAADDHALGSVGDPDGREVVLLARIWREKITADHPELAGQEQAVIATVEHPITLSQTCCLRERASIAARARPVAGCWWS